MSEWKHEWHVTACTMGWIGDTSRVMDTLKAWDADKDEEGRFLLRARSGKTPSTFLGMGDEMVLPDDIEFCVKGEWELLCPLISGGVRVMVI